ncbi:hypothetical protein AB835_10795 [Candidatus Endobugula sertula]|uniref:DNA mismatch repair proteins mutS family domain-containing protein n=1 Tax=Candidatus Endobugula sertula TaxID=62101 RepID=A0A1D2QNF3_9GAMM|nr:hypothetical protein AB835_10795 [Candidatus Endobugula sertula]
MCENLLRQFLLSPPPKSVADDIRQSLLTLTTIESPFPEFPVANPARYVKTLQKQEAGPDILRDLFNVADSFLHCHQSSQAWSLVHILRVVSHSLNFVVKPEGLASVSQLILDTLATVLPDGEDAAYLPAEEMISKHLFEFVESEFRGHVAKTASAEMIHAYQRVKRAALRYEKVLTEDLIPLIHQRSKQRQDHKQLKPWALSFDIHNKAIWLRGLVQQDLKLDNTQNLYHPVDRYGKTVKDRWTTARVEKYLGEYKLAAEQARHCVATLLSDISKQLAPHSLSIVQLATFSNVMRTFLLHTKACKPKHWSLAVDNDSTSRLDLESFFPYWMSAHGAVKNSLTLNDMAVLTGHNMAGKSTTIRSAAVVSLLAAVGFMFPAKRVGFSDIIDGWYLRTGSYDDPAAGLSTFAVEMNDIHIALRDASSHTLVLIDELGKGTETRSGHAIAASVLEYLQAKNIRGIFSTHWHELFFNPAVQLDAMQMISMAVNEEGEPSYKIVAGSCLSSAAYRTAFTLGFNNHIITRAQEIEKAYTKYVEINEQQEYSFTNVMGRVAEESPIYEVHSLTRASHLLSEITQQPLSQIKTVAANMQASIADSQHSVIYVLRTSLGFYYVGETDNIHARVEAHRKIGSKKNCVFIYTLVPLGKSTARKIESTLIKKMTLLGFPLLSADDAKHQHFGSA